ncbi:MAG: DnaA/Hda family protein, partial [Candidatus Sumerlaeia bacterium]|nr:DnaA/Hda family protein [Candidatus Sumerlaeia bacterium]
DEVADWYQRILKYEPDNINFRYNLIEVLQAQGKITAATREYFALAEWYERQENYEEAINTYRQILTLAPAEESAYYALIRLYKDQADYENATRQICALAELYQRQHKIQPAIEILEQVFEYEPEHIEIHRKIIALALQANDTARALSQYARLYAIYYERGNYEMAAAVQREAIQLSPAEPALREPLIKALVSARKTEEAVAELFNLAGIYSDRQQYDRVLQTCSQILEHDPHNLRAHRLKAQTFLNLGDEKKALAEFIHLSAALDSIPIVAGDGTLSPPAREVDLTPRLKVMKEYTFENFVVGEHNHFAYATALSVARAPAKNYNPLFIYADVGLGKTHLLHAIANYLSENSPELTLIYTNAEEFTTELVSAIQNNRVNEFRQKYSSVDVLLLDDVHFLAGKERAQEEFFHIFNTLFQAKKQIVVTSDRPPKDIPHLEKRLRSRFGAGVIVDIQSPEFETRLAILKKELEAHPESKIPENIINLIAERVEWNVRELKGALTQVIAMKDLSREELSEERVRQMLDSLFEKV